MKTPYYLFYLIVCILISCRSEKSASNSPDVLQIEPSDTISVFGDSLYFRSIHDMDMVNDMVYLSLFNENIVAQTNNHFEVTGTLKSTGKGLAEIIGPTQMAVNDQYLIVNDDGNRPYEGCLFRWAIFVFTLI